MKIINAKVYTEEGIFEKKDVYTDGELISEKSGDDEVLDAESEAASQSPLCRIWNVLVKMWKAFVEIFKNR